MNEFYNYLLNNLYNGQILHITGLGTQYTFAGWSRNGSLKYQINAESKYIPAQTLIACKAATDAGLQFTRVWYRQQYPRETAHSPCNFYVIKALLE